VTARSLSFLKRYHDRGTQTKLSRRRACSRGHLTLPGAQSRTSFVFFVDLVQAAIKSAARSPLEMAAREDGEQMLREWAIARDGHTGLFEDSLRPTRSSANVNEAHSSVSTRLPPDVQKRPDITPDAPLVLPRPCPPCGTRMIVIERPVHSC
jgi:hypothetical protein